MTQTVEVEINEAGEIRPLDPSLKIPKGRAILVCPDENGRYPFLMPGESFADWFTPEDEAAWAHLQPENQV